MAMFDSIRTVLPPGIARKGSDYMARILNRPVINQFGSRHGRHALISYITSPLRRGVKITHTNTVEVIEIAKIFDRLGYRVDAVYYDERRPIDYGKYSAILGFGDPLIRSFYNRKVPVSTIYYGTGMHVFHQNTESLKRAEDVFRRRGVWLLESCRLVDKTYTVQTTLVDAMIVLGNDRVVDSYQPHYSGKIYKVYPSFLKVADTSEILRGRDISMARKNFCWFGGQGMVHKGLDLVLDVFKELPDFHLHVCGPIEGEPRFAKCYEEELYGTENIHTHGYVRLDSPRFREILSSCAFTVFPSCSEGAPSSVLNVMGNGGLIPIVTRETGIDTLDFGIPIDSLTIADVKKAVLEAAALEDRDIHRRSHRCAESTAACHSIENYARQMMEVIPSILDGKK